MSAVHSREDAQAASSYDIDVAGPVLVVDDEATILHVIRSLLEASGHVVITCTSAEQALDHLATGSIAVALTDIVLPNMSGLELLDEARRTAPDTEIILMTSHASLEAAMEAIHHGAYDFIQKPFDDIESVSRTVTRALAHRELTLRNRRLVIDLQQKNTLLAATVSRLSTLTHAGLAMGDVYDASGLLDYVLGLIVREFDAPRASVMLLDPSGTLLRIAASYGLSGLNTADVEVPVGQGIAGRVAATGDPMLVRDLSEDPTLPVQANPSLSDSFMCAPIAVSLPIKTREKVLGVLNVTDRVPGRTFGDEDLGYLSAISCQLAMAIERARFVEELRQAYETLKATQAELIFSERVKAIGEIAAGVAHDYNNTLGALLARVQLALHRLSGPRADVPQAVADLVIAEKVAAASAATIKRIQDFGKRGTPAAHALLSVNDIVASAVEMTRPRWKDESEKAGLRIAIDLQLADVPPIRGDAADMTQALSNLLLNAVDALPSGGTIRLRTRLEQERVVVEIQDDGLGIADDIQDKIFHPFFTTKTDGHGLGLSIVQNIVARHAGDLKVVSRPGEGATFRLRFPAAERAMTVRTEAPVARPVRGLRSARILLVDDLDEVRESCREMLAAGGHVVTEASGGREAIGLLGRSKFDLVVTDLGMPEVSGFEVAKASKRTAPDVPVVLLSGWVIDQDEARVRESGIDRVLPKPCPMSELLAAVEAALTSGCRLPGAPA